MYHCRKCQRAVADKDDLCYGLCLYCYRDLLYERIEHLDDPDYKVDIPKEHKISDFIKRLFKK